MNRLIRLSAAALVGAASFVAAPANARADSFSIEFSAGRHVHHERHPRAHWVPGFWEWHHGRYVWIEGYWARPAPVAVHALRPFGHGARWDRDGDGVPNRYDRRPNNPHRH